MTHDQWKAFKKSHGLTNAKIAEIIGTSTQNVNNQISPSKPLPTWAKMAIYVEELKNAKRGCV